MGVENTSLKDKTACTIERQVYIIDQKTRVIDRQACDIDRKARTIDRLTPLVSDAARKIEHLLDKMQDLGSENRRLRGVCSDVKLESSAMAQKLVSLGVDLGRLVAVARAQQTEMMKKAEGEQSRAISRAKALLGGIERRRAERDGGGSVGPQVSATVPPPPSSPPPHAEGSVVSSLQSTSTCGAPRVEGSSSVVHEGTVGFAVEGGGVLPCRGGTPATRPIVSLTSMPIPIDLIHAADRQAALNENGPCGGSSADLASERPAAPVVHARRPASVGEEKDDSGSEEHFPAASHDDGDAVCAAALHAAEAKADRPHDILPSGVIHEGFSSASEESFARGHGNDSGAVACTAASSAADHRTSREGFPEMGPAMHLSDANLAAPVSAGLVPFARAGYDDSGGAECAEAIYGADLPTGCDDSQLYSTVSAQILDIPVPPPPPRRTGVKAVARVVRVERCQASKPDALPYKRQIAQVNGVEGRQAPKPDVAPSSRKTARYSGAGERGASKPGFAPFGIRIARLIDVEQRQAPKLDVAPSRRKTARCSGVEERRTSKPGAAPSKSRIVRPNGVEQRKAPKPDAAPSRRETARCSGVEKRGAFKPGGASVRPPFRPPSGRRPSPAVRASSGLRPPSTQATDRTRKPGVPAPTRGVLSSVCPMPRPAARRGYSVQDTTATRKPPGCMKDTATSRMRLRYPIRGGAPVRQKAF